MKETKGEPDMNLREHILPKINVLNLVFIFLKYLYTDFHVRSLFCKKSTSTLLLQSIFTLFSQLFHCTVYSELCFII